jgi:16S rRNA (uracil1498-N3)-methyltransferase
VTARRFFVEGTREVGDVVEIDRSDAEKIVRVLRLARGDRIEIVDSAASPFEAAIESIGAAVRATLLDRLQHAPTPAAVRVEVAQAVPKAQRMDFVVEKGTELGAAAFLPFYCERSVGRAAGAQKLERWRRLARSAAQQSGRMEIPQVHDPVPYAALLERFGDYDRIVFAWELVPPAPLHAALQSALPRAGRVLVVIGPEGGFTHAEAEAAAQRGATLISLGSRILRTDTAAIALLAVIGALAS